MFRFLPFLFIIVCSPSFSQEKEYRKHRIEINWDFVFNNSQLNKMVSHMEKNGFGETHFNNPIATQIFTDLPSSVSYPKIDKGGRMGFSGYYGYSIKKNMLIGLIAGYSYLGRIEGNTMDSTKCSFVFDQFHLIPSFRYEVHKYFNFNAGIGVSYTRTEPRGPEPYKIESNPNLCIYLSTDLVIPINNFFFKFGLGYFSSPFNNIGPFNIDGNILPELDLGFNYVNLKLTLLGFKF